MTTRPRRLFIDKNERYFYLVKGKKKYVKIPKTMSQKQVQKINLVNIVNPPEVKKVKRKKRKRLSFDRDFIGNMKKISTTTPSGTLTTFVQFSKPPLQAPQAPSINIRIDRSIIPPVDTISKRDLKEFRESFILARPQAPKPLSVVQGIPVPSRPDDNESVSSGLSFSASADVTPIKKPVKAERRNTSIFTPVEPPPTTPPRLSYYTRSAPTNQPRSSQPPGFFRQITTSMGDRTTTTRVPFEREPDTILQPMSNQNYRLVGFTERPPLPPISRQTSDIESRRTSVVRTRSPSKDRPDSDIRSNARGKGDDDGLFNDEIENIMKKRINRIVPVIPIDKFEDLLNSVKVGDKEFMAVVNTNNSKSDGSGTDGHKAGHWRAVYINNRDDFPSIEFFDPFGDDPEKHVLKTMKEIGKKMNPETMFLYKPNRMILQSDDSSNCGHFCIKFLEDRHSGVPFNEATYYEDYIKKCDKDYSDKGENEIQKFKQYL